MGMGAWEEGGFIGVKFNVLVLDLVLDLDLDVKF